MEQLSTDIPKPMLTVHGKSLLHHKLDLMPSLITEVIIVVGYLKEKIIDVIGHEYHGRKITYIVDDQAVQGNFFGTAHALSLCKEYFDNKDERFLVLMGDDIYPREDMQACIDTPEWSILVRQMPSILGKANVIFDTEGHLQEIREKSKEHEPGCVCAGMYLLTPKIFDYEMVSVGGGEFGLPQTILSARNDIKINAVVSTEWFQITNPEDIKDAEIFFEQNEK
jgi:NDP-sugar pyrophosphorylase family protein